MKIKSKSPEQIKKEVRRGYGNLITKSSCCCPCNSECIPSDTQSLKRIGYQDEDIDSLPGDSSVRSFGCGNPLSFAEIKEGQTVLDIGSGAGIDCFLAARKTGKSGKVIGLDMTPAMIKRARENAAKVGYEQVEFRLGDAESMPLEGSSVDWVISNCVINLSPDKPKVFKEISRVLKPGGRISITDIVLGEALPDWITANMAAWTGCVAGAIREKDYIDGLRIAGLEKIEVDSRIQFDIASIQSFIETMQLSRKVHTGRQDWEIIQKNIWSARIRACKPVTTS